MDSLYKFQLNLDEEYLSILNHIIKGFFSYVFLILIEGNTNVNAVTLLIYNLVGILFYNLVFKKIIIFE